MSVNNHESKRDRLQEGGEKVNYWELLKNYQIALKIKNMNVGQLNSPNNTKKTILELHKNGENWKVDAIINRTQKKWCNSYGKICPNSKRGTIPSPAVFSHKAIESDSDEISLNEENFHCYNCADDILWGLETSRSGVMVKNPEALVMLRQALNRLF